MNSELEYKAIEFGDKTLLVLDKQDICLTVNTQNYKMWSMSELQVKIYEAIKRMPYFCEEKSYGINTVYIFVTELCNLCCTFCSMRSDQKNINPKTEMNEMVVQEKIMPFLKRVAPRKIIISGGEPLLNKDIIPIIKIISASLKTRIIVQSNGTLLNENIISAVAGVIDSIEISTSHYEDVYELEPYIQFCLKKNIYLTFSYVYEGDITKLYNVIDLVAKYDLGFILNFVAPTGSALDRKCYILKSQERLFVFRKLVEYILNNGYSDKKLADFLKTPINPKKPCGAYGRMIAIFPDCDVYLCHSLKHEEYRIGNLLQQDGGKIEKQWKALLEKENVKRLFDFDNILTCKTCKFSPICGGICAGEKHNRREFDCTLKKVIWLYNILFYDKGDTAKDNLEKFVKLTDNIEKYDEYLV